MAGDLQINGLCSGFANVTRMGVNGAVRLQNPNRIQNGNGNGHGSEPDVSIVRYYKSRTLFSQKISDFLFHSFLDIHIREQVKSQTFQLLICHDNQESMFETKMKQTMLCTNFNVAGCTNHTLFSQKILILSKNSS